MKRVFLFGLMVCALSFLPVQADEVGRCDFNTFEGYRACRMMINTKLNLPTLQKENIKQVDKNFFAMLEPKYKEKALKEQQLSNLMNSAKPNNAKIAALRSEIDALDKEISLLRQRHHEIYKKNITVSQKNLYRDIRQEVESSQGF